MAFLARVLKLDRAKDMQEINRLFKANLDGIKKTVEKNSAEVYALLDMIYDTSFPEEQVFLKTPSKPRLKTQEKLVSRLLSGLVSQGVPATAMMLDFVRKHGVEPISEALLSLLELLSPFLDGKAAPEFTTDDMLDAIVSGWHGSPNTASPLINAFASIASSPRLSAASASESPLQASSPYRRAFSERPSPLQLVAKSISDKASPRLSNSTSAAPYFGRSKTTVPEITESRPSYSHSMDIPPLETSDSDEPPQKKHRRKSSSLRQLFAADSDVNDAQSGSESPVTAAKARLTPRASLDFGATSSKFSASARISPSERPSRRIVSEQQPADINKEFDSSNTFSVMDGEAKPPQKEMASLVSSVDSEASLENTPRAADIDQEAEAASMNGESDTVVDHNNWSLDSKEDVVQGSIESTVATHKPECGKADAAIDDGTLQGPVSASKEDLKDEHAASLPIADNSSSATKGSLKNDTEEPQLEQPNSELKPTFSKYENETDLVGDSESQLLPFESTLAKFKQEGTCEEAGALDYAKTLPDAWNYGKKDLEIEAVTGPNIDDSSAPHQKCVDLPCASLESTYAEERNSKAVNGIIPDVALKNSEILSVPSLWDAQVQSADLGYDDEANILEIKQAGVAQADDIWPNPQNFEGIDPNIDLQIPETRKVRTSICKFVRLLGRRKVLMIIYQLELDPS